MEDFDPETKLRIIVSNFELGGVSNSHLPVHYG